LSLPKPENEEVYTVSDMEQIKCITDLDVAERNLARGLTYGKIGAKFTNCVQACDCNDAFKIKQRDARITTVQDKTTPLKLTVENGMARLKRQGRLIIGTRKTDVIVDAAATGPAMQGKAYSVEKNQKCFASAGYLDEGRLLCPDIHAIMASSNINFKKNPHIRTLLRQTIVALVRLGYETGGTISEEKYDELEYPLDMDVTGQVWHLPGKSEVYARSKSLCMKI